jgi:hypothetical protein
VLLEEKRIDEAWIVDALRRPASLRFAIAAPVANPYRSPVMRDALLAALDTDARDGAAAAEAARALASHCELLPEDPRLPRILERTSEEVRSRIIMEFIGTGASLAPIRGHVMELLLSANEEVAKDVLWYLREAMPEGTQELCEAALRLEPSPATRRRLEDYLGIPSEAALYWQDDREGDELTEEAEGQVD